MSRTLSSPAKSDTAYNSPSHKPLLRGWSHALAAVAAVVVTILLLIETRSDGVRFVSILIFGLSMIGLYLGSAVYHLGRWRGRHARVLRAIDHANIFFLIAGTYTPICVNVLTGWHRIAVLSLVWTIGLAGALAKVMHLRLPRWASTGLYLGMGWVALIALPQLTAALPWQAIAMLISGGVLYSIGAVIYALKRPNPLPRIFGFHEIFHLFTIAGGAAFIMMIWIWVLPFPRG
jgi:hemolysin III